MEPTDMGLQRVRKQQEPPPMATNSIGSSVAPLPPHDGASPSSPQLSLPALSRTRSSPPSPSPSSSHVPPPPRDNSASTIVMVEAVFLVTTLDQQPTSPPFRRLVYVAPTATLPGQLLPMMEGGSVDFEDVLHMFCGTKNGFEVVLRFAEPAAGLFHGVKLFVHEANIVNNAIASLLVMSTGGLSPPSVSAIANAAATRTTSSVVITNAAVAATAYSLSVGMSEASPQLSQTRKRLQIFDQERCLLFTKEWEVDVGILNEDAISWLRDWHCSIDELVRQGEGEDEDEVVRTTPTPMSSSPLRPSSLAPGSISGAPEGGAGMDDSDSSSNDGNGGSRHSRAPSIAASFVNLDDRASRRNTISRSDSITTSTSPLAPDTTKTVDFLQQVGFWIYGTRVGQMVASYDPTENLKTLYSQSPIWLLGRQFVNDEAEMTYPRTLSMGPISAIVGIKSPVQKLHIQRMDLEAVNGHHPSQYVLRECLKISFCDVECILPRIASWLEVSRWRASYAQTARKGDASKDVAMRLEAASEDGGLHFEMHLMGTSDDLDTCLADCRIMAGSEGALVARTVFVDIISQLVVVCGSASIEFLYLEAHGSHIEVGPHPHSLLPFTTAASQASSPSNDEPTLEIDTLLWSEHIHDWVLRRLRSRRRDGPLIEVCSLQLPVDSLSLDISRCSVYFFADSSLRFAVAYAGTWLCFRSTGSDDFYTLMHWFPTILSGTKGTGSAIESNGQRSASSSTGLFSRRLPSGSSSYSTANTAQMVSTSASQAAPPPSDNGIKDFLDSFESRFWFTYRRDFVRLSPSILSSDAGFGCMIRAGQSMMAEGLAKILLGEQRRLAAISVDARLTEAYKTIISLFLDVPDPSAVFSIHNLCGTGAALGTPIGQYFSPSVLARTLRRQCRQRDDIPCTIQLIKQGIIDLDVLVEAATRCPVILLVPLRLGADSLNEEYAPLIKASLACPLTIGIVGGQASRAFYIVGYQDDALLYLDPHHLRPINLNMDKIIASQEYHTRSVCELLLRRLDPTVLLAFLCQGVEDVRFVRNMLLSAPVPMPLFSTH